MVMFQDQQAGKNHNIKTGNKSFQWVEQFTYLRTTMKNHNSIHEEIKSRLKSGNACHHSVQNLFSCLLLSYVCLYLETHPFIITCLNVKISLVFSVCGSISVFSYIAPDSLCVRCYVTKHMTYIQYHQFYILSHSRCLDLILIYLIVILITFIELNFTYTHLKATYTSTS
jgi:hypothetical protein